MCRTVCPQHYGCAELCVLRIIDVQNLCVLSTEYSESWVRRIVCAQNCGCAELCVLRIIDVQNLCVLNTEYSEL